MLEKRQADTHPEGLCMPPKEGLDSILRVMGSFDTCSCVAPPTENRNSMVAETCHLVRHSVLRSPVPGTQQVLTVDTCVSRECIDWRGLSRGLNATCLLEMSHRCRGESESERWGPREWEIRQLLQSPRARLAGAGGNSHLLPRGSASLGEKHASCPILEFMRKDLSGNGVPLPKCLSSSGALRTCCSILSLQIRGIFFLNRRHEEIWLVLWDAFFGNPNTKDYGDGWNSVSWNAAHKAKYEESSPKQENWSDSVKTARFRGWHKGQHKAEDRVASWFLVFPEGLSFHYFILRPKAQ